MKEYNEEEFLSEIKHGLIAVNKDVTKRKDNSGNLLIYHFCGYIGYPNEESRKHLLDELKTNVDFKLDNIDEIEIIDAPEWVVKYFKNSM